MIVDDIQERLLQAIHNHVFPGCVLGIVTKNSQQTLIPVGRYTYEPTSPLVTNDSILDVASITKSIPTSSLALKLIGEGRLHLEDKLIAYLPEFANSDRDLVLIKHLLTQTLDYNFRLSSFKDHTPSEILQVILTTNFNSQPGTKFFYTNATSILLGLVVERILGQKLDELADHIFFEQLEMRSTSFHPERLQGDRIVPTEIDSWRGEEIRGVVHDESTYTLNKQLIIGAAGLFSTAPDLLRFLGMLLNDGKCNGHRYISTEMINQIHTNQLGAIQEQAGLGWELFQPRYMGHNCTPRTFGKTGFTGCVVICDREKGVALTLLSNATYPHRKTDSTMINAVRHDIADIIFA